MRVLAWANVILHLAGLALAAVGMAPGTGLVPLAERLEYLAAAPAGWVLGWVAWMLCAGLLVAYLAVLMRRLGVDAELARLGLVIAVVGAGFDLLCDIVYICVFPLVAGWQPLPEQLFLVVERITNIGSLVVGNGAYSVAIIMISAAIRARSVSEGADSLAYAAGSVSNRVVWLGYGVGICGLVLAAAGFTGSAVHAMWATLPTIGLFCVWVVLVARALEPGGRPT